MRPLCFALAVLLTASCAQAQPKNPTRSKKREIPMEQIIREAGLDLLNPRPEALQKVNALLRKEDKKGIWLAAPSPLGIDKDRDVTITGFDFYSTEKRGRKYLSESGIVVATRVESRETFAALIEEQKEPADPDTPPDTRPIPPSESIQRFQIPLRERLPDLPWRAGTYIVDVILEPEVSNRAKFQLTSGLAAEKDPAIAEYIEQQRAASAGPQAAYPADPRPAKSLEIPATNGLTLDADRVSVYRPDSKALLRGSFRVPSAPGPVPITLVMVGNIMPGPFVVPLRIPTERTPGAPVQTGTFEVDLFALKETSKVPQTYTIWAYHGDLRSAPAKAAFITPDMLK